MPYKAGYRKKRTVRRKAQQVVIPYNPRNVQTNSLARNVARALPVASRVGASLMREASNYIKRRKQGAKVPPTNKKDYTPINWGTQGPSELTWTRLKSGPRTSKFTVRDLTKIATYKQVVRWQNIAPIDKGLDRGALWLASCVCSDAAIGPFPYTLFGQNFIDNISTLSDNNLTTGYLRAPFHLYLLNQTKLHEKADTGPAYQTFIKQDDGSIHFTNLYGTESTNLASKEWQTEYASQGIPLMQQYVKQAWYQIKLALRNAPNQATFFDVWVFSFKEGYLDPLETPASDDEIRDRKTLYQGLASEGMRNPIADYPGLNKVMKNLKIMKKIRVVMNKQQSDDTNVSPDTKVVKWFIRDGKMYDYMYSGNPTAQAGAGNAALTLSTNNQWKDQGPGVTGNQTSPNPKARARVWLMVRAYDPTINASAGADVSSAYSAITTASSPSYDICIRKEELARIN